MRVLDALKFHSLKLIRMCWYNIYYRITKWKNLRGISIPVYLKYGYSVLRFIDDGSYECQEMNIIESRLKSSDKVLELGTGIGFISTYCAKIVGNDNIHTYEANPFMEEVIKEVYDKNNVDPKFEIALVGDKNSGNEFVAQNDFLSSSQKDAGKDGKKISVPLLNLNAIILKYMPSYLVMDIEGNELEVFSIIDFQSIHKVQFELHPSLLKQDEIDFIFRKLADNYFEKDQTVSTDKNYYFERKKLPS